MSKYIVEKRFDREKLKDLANNEPERFKIMSDDEIAIECMIGDTPVTRQRVWTHRKKLGLTKR